MIAKLFTDHRPLMVAGVVSFVCGIVAIILTQIDPTMILGINRWIKPMKFFISIAIFLWTIAILLDQLKGYERFSRIISWTMIMVFTGEMIGVAGQAARGTTSHFNITTPDSAIVYALMGVLIVINSLLVVAIAVVYFRDGFGLPPAVLWGIRLGLLLFIAGSIQGGYMSAQLGHTVGAADGGPGLPLTNWSTVAGDLRVAHFLGLHSIQIMPLVGILVDRMKLPMASVYGVAILYVALFVAVLVQALIGRPLISI